MKVPLYLACCFFLLSSFSAPQTDTLIIGKPCPNIILQHIEGWPGGTASIADLTRNKWLILDFWNRGCAACVAGFSGTNRMYQKYADRVNFMMVAFQDRDDLVHQIWHQYREKEKLTLPCSFDSLPFRQLDFHSAPQVVIVDNHGILRGWVSGITDKVLDSLLDGTKTYVKRLPVTPFYYKSPLLLYGNGGTDDDYAYRSMITKWTPSMGAFRPGTIMYAVGSDLFQATTCSMQELFNYAFWGYTLFLRGRADPAYGKVSLYTVFELRDTSRVNPNYRECRNLYAYSLSVPGDLLTADQIKTSMQKDLENYFKCTAAIETRDMPYYALVATDSARARLRTQGGSPTFAGSPTAKYALTNKPISVLLSIVSVALDRDGVFLDETGIYQNIDITMDATLMDKELVIAELHRNGLDIVRRIKPMRVVVVRDKQ